MVAEKKNITNFLNLHKSTLISHRNGEGTGCKEPRKAAGGTVNSPQLTCACFYIHSQEYTSPLTPAPTALCWGCLSPSCSARREESKEGGADEPASQTQEEKENEEETEDRGREREHTESEREREKEKSVLEPEIDFSDRVFPKTKVGNSTKVESEIGKPG